MWEIDADVLESISLGAGILGTGGGGNPYVAKIWARGELERGARFRILDPLDPADLPDDAWVVGSGGIGAPTVSVEKLRRGDEEYRALRALEAHLGVRFDAVVPMEVGGGNSIRPIIAAAQAGIPTVDADGMGRAFPELQMVTFFMYGVPPCPAAIADDKGEEAVFTAAPSPQRLERMARVLTVEMGGTAGMAFAPMRGTDLKRTAIPRTLSVARDVGAAVRAARARNADPVEALFQATGGSLLLTGKIVDVERRTGGGFARGSLSLLGSGPHGNAMRIDFQNENLIAYGGEATATGGAEAEETPIATVPDLICIVSTDAAEPITTELLRYGQRVSVVGIRCHPLLSTPAALAVVGPGAFGYDVAYRPLVPGGPLPWTVRA
jgi:DUF917 family protein